MGQNRLHYFRIQKTRQYLRFKFWKFNVYFTLHPLSVRQGGVERSYRKKKRNRLKERLILERGCCEHCGKPLVWDTASVHHIIPRCVDPSREFDITNLQLMCHECHMRIHQIEQLRTMIRQES